MKRHNTKVRLAMTLAGLGFLPSIAFGAITPSQMPGGGAVIATNTGTTVDGAGAGSSITGLNPGATVSLSNTSNNTAFAVIRWGGTSAPTDATNAGGFNIGSTAALTFASSSQSGGAVLNIDASGNPSEIDGALTGNHTAIYVANENGIVIGPSAAISLPLGGAFLAWNMDNTTAVQEFVGNNSATTSYLDIGKLSTPGNITIDKGANITAGSAQVLISGADVVNSGDITVGPTTANYTSGSITIAAGWRPIKASDTVNGTSGTATYRISPLYNYGTLYSRGISSFEPGSSAGFSGTFTNNGVISSTTANNGGAQGSMVILSQSGMANFGTLKTANQDMGIYNTFNDVALNGTIDAPSVGSSLPGVSYVAQTTTGTSRFYLSYSTQSLVVVDPYAKILLGDVYNVSGKMVTVSSNVAAGSMALAGYDIQGLNGTTPISANSLYLAATANINAPGSSNYLKNGLGIQPLTSGQTVDLHLIPAGAASGNYNVINLNVQGNALVDSIAQTPVSEAVDQTGYTGSNGTYYNSPAQTDSSGNYGSAPAGYTVSYTDPTAHASSMLIQATGNMTITAPNNGSIWPFFTSYENLYNNTFAQPNSGNSSYNIASSGAPFAFSGGIALNAGGTLTVNVPMINAWGSNAGVPFQGFYLEGQAITIANDAWFMSNYDNVVNVSSTPSGNSTGSYVPNVYWMVGGVSNPPSSVNASFGTAVFNNTYTTTVANAATYPTSWAQMQSNTPLPATQ